MGRQRLARMAETWILQGAKTSKRTTSGRSHGVRKSQDDNGVAPLFWVLSLNLAVAACFFLVLYSLLQPKINANPGLAAYTPPAGTRLIPLPRESNAPELAELPAVLPTALAALAQAQPADQHPKPDSRPPAHPRRRADPNDFDQRRNGSPQLNFGYRGWSDRAWSSNSKPWF
jgi:hypothetical protein